MFAISFVHILILYFSDTSEDHPPKEKRIEVEVSIWVCTYVLILKIRHKNTSATVVLQYAEK